MILKDVLKPKMQHNFGGESLATWNPRSVMNHYKSDAYSSAYPSIRTIANDFMTIRPYTIDANGKPVDSAVKNALYHPNQKDSSVSFFEKLAVCNLTLKNTYILVWRMEGREAKAGGEITPKNIAGFTFLESPAIKVKDGKTYYSIGSQEFSEKEVITIPGGVDPYHLYGGYSPSVAARRWAKLDDYVADYQAGFFENGAVPSGQFVVTAATKQDFNDIVDKLQSRHRGAGNNNNVTYTHRPIDTMSGKPVDAQIEWIPFSVTNKDIALKDIFDQSNKRLDLAFGVPQIVKGVDDAATYANAQVADKTFSQRAVYPMALRIWTQFTHELNRITGGMGVAITFDYEIPALADEDKVKAETKVLESSVITTMTAAGYSLDSIVEAFELSNSYKLLKEGEKPPVIENDKPDVDEGDEVNSSPDPDDIDGITPLNHTHFKNEVSDFNKIYAVAEDTMQRQIDKAVSELTEDDIKNEITDPNTDDEDQFIAEMMVVISAIVLTYGDIQYAEGKKLIEAAGFDTENLTEFMFDDIAKGRYSTYLRKVGNSYMTDTAKAIRDVLANAKRNELTLKQTKDSLRAVMHTDEYRVKRLAETELNRSQSMGSIESMIEIKNQTGAQIQKGLVHSGGDAPCEFCATLLDRWVDVEQDFVMDGETVVGIDGGMYINNFTANYGYDIHPNGHCSPQFRVVK